ncbi:Uncharacterised protein [Starkeya nomas]|uniref:DNA-directed DNA polymerase family A palm domain-containing protein n=1 Tax=Starkeya nomas TaxID=2666134 RepID=A0A5S9NLP7_9HYPH|nr:hypothetical protein [Starkeya nomas]CAA0090892.1 Uncharacterised protein [Starkeya nomas]
MNKQPEPPVRHRWFDDWRGARGTSLRKLVSDITSEVEALEQVSGARKRARKVVDKARFEAAVEVVLSNLAHEVLVPSEAGRLAILTGNGAKGATRYDNKALGEPLRTLLGHLQELGLVDWQWTGERGVASSLAPTQAFRSRVERAGIAMADFGRVPGEETILLSAKLPLGGEGSGLHRRERLPYVDTPNTTAMRAAVEALNGFLAGADIGFAEDGLGAVDTSDRRMRRHFVLRAGANGEAPVVSFDLGGRLFGGFWQNLPSSRRRGIRINGEPVAELDYGQMAVRLAYATVGATPPEDDMYALPGLEGHRAAVKIAFNTLLNAGPKMTRWGYERMDGAEGQDASERLPEGWTVKRTKAAILARHPALAPCLGSGIGLKLMHMESVMLVAVLEEMMEREVVGLGIHDGVLAPASKAEEVRTIMEKMAVAKAGTTIPVSVEAHFL